MKENVIKVNTSVSSYDIHIGSDLICDANTIINIAPDRKYLIITDENIPTSIIDKVRKNIDNSFLYVLKPSENSKNFENYKSIQEFLLKNNFSRADSIIAIGGGMVGDISAFVASTYMRGISFYNIPTTLLSQVDSSIGGKTAINLSNVKNIVGTFYEPKGVIIDTTTLRTLEKRELYSGLVESIKMAATLDIDFFEFLKNCDDIMPNISTIITKSIMLKKMIVEKDEKENNIRKVLNFGHTIGHAIEEQSDYKLLHGECVGIGMLYFSSDDVKNEISSLLKKYNLPTSYNIDKNKVTNLISHDKKSTGDTVSIIYVDKIGTYEIRKMSLDEISKLL